MSFIILSVILRPFRKVPCKGLTVILVCMGVGDKTFPAGGFKEVFLAGGVLLLFPVGGVKLLLLAGELLLFPAGGLLFVFLLIFVGYDNDNDKIRKR